MSLVVSVLGRLVASRQHPVTSVMVLFEIFLARNNSSFPEPVLLGEERCLSSLKDYRIMQRSFLRRLLLLKEPHFAENNSVKAHFQFL